MCYTEPVSPLPGPLPLPLVRHQVSVEHFDAKLESMDGLNSTLKQIQRILDTGTVPSSGDKYQAICRAILEHGVFPTLQQVCSAAVPTLT